MKKFENLGRMLSKEEQKKIMGGDAPGGGSCSSPNQNYTCDLIYTDESTATKDFCAESLIAAKAAALNSANNVWSADCILAS